MVPRLPKFVAFAVAVAAVALPLRAVLGQTAPTTVAGAPSVVLRSVEHRQPTATILNEVVLAKQPDRYIGWPSIVATNEGELIAVFSGDRDWHVCPWGKVMAVRSRDGGKTWTAPEVIIDTPLDDRDTGVTKLANGDLLISFNVSLAFDNPKVDRYKKYQEHAASLDKATREKWVGPWTILSKDNGKTWSEPRKSPASTPHGPTPLKNGGLLYVRPNVLGSTDSGVTWTELARIDRDPATWVSRYAFLSEQHALEVADGHIIALSRYASKGNADVRLRQMESTDGGNTWTQPTPTEMKGYPAHLLKLQNGWLLASYGRRIAPMGQRASISKDNGKTWLVDQEIQLSAAVPQGAGDLGYPGSAQLPDGSIWTVYYQVEKQGEQPSLMATHWKLAE